MEIKAEEDAEQNVFTFQDNQPALDPLYEYSDAMTTAETPLIIDNGSYKCRAGWMTDDNPRLVFKNLIAKQRSKKNPQENLEVQIGNDISNLEVVRWQLKSPFERDIVTQYDCQEQVFDYTFNHLGINTNGFVNHPIVLTETVCNPHYCRQKMSELLFECYQVPSVAYGVDAMFSLYKNHPSPETATGLVLSCGYNATHVLPVMDGRVDAQHARRLNLGGSHMEMYLQKLLQLRYPGHVSHLSLSRAEEVLQAHCRVAVDYQEELSRWADEDYYCDYVYKYQLPYSAAASSLVLQDAQKERREQQVKRLKELNKRKREEKLAECQDKLRELLTLQELYEDEDEQTFSRALAQYDVSSPEMLQEKMTSLSVQVQRLRQKCVQEEYETKTESQKRGEKKLDLSDLVPDDSPEGMEEWIRCLRRDRQDILDKRAGRKQRKVDMTKRRTHASQQRMKIITELARGSRKKKEDTFGANDDDWNVYKQINKDAGDSDSEAEQIKIDEIETYLREYDPSFKDPSQMTQEVDVKEYYRIHVGVEQIRIPELLFQPSMIGLDQAGLSETVDFVLAKYSPEDQARLVQRVFVTGGAATFPGLVPRLTAELRATRPFQSTFDLCLADNPSLDAWHGARSWAERHLASHSITRADYEEKGTGYLREHTAANHYAALPDSPTKATNQIAGISDTPTKVTIQDTESPGMTGVVDICD